MAFDQSQGHLGGSPAGSRGGGGGMFQAEEVALLKAGGTSLRLVGLSRHGDGEGSASAELCRLWKACDFALELSKLRVHSPISLLGSSL